MCLIQHLIVVRWKTCEECLKRLGYSDAYLITTVVHSLEEIHVHCVQAIGVKGWAAESQDLLDDTTGDETRRAAVIFKEGGQLGLEVSNNITYLQ